MELLQTTTDKLAEKTAPKFHVSHVTLSNYEKTVRGNCLNTELKEIEDRAAALARGQSRLPGNCTTNQCVCALLDVVHGFVRAAGFIAEGTDMDNYANAAKGNSLADVTFKSVAEAKASAKAIKDLMQAMLTIDASQTSDVAWELKPTEAQVTAAHARIQKFKTEEPDLVAKCFVTGTNKLRSGNAR
eukprot:SAG11_NODE_2792_length_2967_cov_3.635983_3_plen_187_part_00